MSKLIASKILKTSKKEILKHPKGRNIIGVIASSISLFFNTILGVAKVAVGVIFHSIAIVSDGINNVTDSTSSVVSLVGFKISNMPADKKHPFGHARVEYISSMIISFIISVLGIELIINSIKNIIAGSESTFSIISICILAGSIVVKAGLALYNYSCGKFINSSSLKSVAIDCFNDCISTLIVMISSIIAHFTSFNADGYAGAIIGLVITVQGIKLLIDTCNPLLGEEPNIDLVHELEQKIRAYEGVYGIHDIIIHNYGPNKYFATIHVEVDSSVDINVSHELVDKIERDLTTPTMNVVIHMDPIDTKDEITKEYKAKLIEQIKSIDSRLNIHDFRVLHSDKLLRLIFDVVAPFNFKYTDQELKAKIQEKAVEIAPNCELIFNIDKTFIPDEDTNVL